jgi:hypothetical protein
MGKFDYKKWIIEHKYGIINEQQTPTVDCPEGILYNTDCNNPDVISQVAGNTTDPYWINTCCTGSATGSCDNFASSIPTGITLVDFCIKCETNSWVGSGFEQYCECCPQFQPEKGPGKIPSRRIRKLR